MWKQREPRLETGDKKLETEESKSWKQKRAKVRWKLPAAQNKVKNEIKIISGHSLRPQEPVVKFKFWSHVPL